jgi:hypothetical protein
VSGTPIASRGATMAVDWEQRIDFPALRAHRLGRTQASLVITRFPADELLVAGRQYVRGADFEAPHTAVQAGGNGRPAVETPAGV